MSKASVGSEIIDAGIQEVARALFAIESYPDWTDGITKVSGVVRNVDGNIEKATLTIDAGVIKDEVTLEYDWSQAPGRLNFKAIKGKLLKRMDGAYLLESIHPESTRVTYELSVSVSFFMPQIMVTNQEMAVISRALVQLKEFVER
jgi:hypothetical protein